MYGNSDKPVDFSKKPRDAPRKLQNNVYKGLVYRELGFNLGRSIPEFEAVAEDKLVMKNYLEMRCELPGQTRSTFLMVFSPDGKKVASTHGNHNVYVTDLTTGKNINTLSGHPRTPWCIAFHPSSNQILATGCLGGQVRVWDLHGGSEVWMAEGQTVIASLAFHPTDRMLVIATYNELHFWDWSQSAPFAKCYTNNEKEKVRYVAFDPLGHKLITGISNVPPHSTQWDRSAGSHHLSHHHHLYHHQPFQRTAAGRHAMYCTHHQQSTNMPGEQNDEQLERDGRVHDSIPYPSSPREGRIPSSTAEATSSSTSSSNPPPDYERRISVCYRSLAQRYEQLLQRYFDLVRPRYVVTTDRGTDPMEAEETSGSSAPNAPSATTVTVTRTSRCNCNNTTTNTNTDSNWSVRNRSGTTATTSNVRARKSTRGFCTTVDSSSTPSASGVNGTRTVDSHTRNNLCPRFHSGCAGNVSMCSSIFPSSSSSSLRTCNHTSAPSGTSGVSSTSVPAESSSTDYADMQLENFRSLPVFCPRHKRFVYNRGQQVQPLQGVDNVSVNISSQTSDEPHMLNENGLSSAATRKPAEPTSTVTLCNRMDVEQTENATVAEPPPTRTVPASPDIDVENDSDEQEAAGALIDNQTTLLSSTEPGNLSTSQIHRQHSPDDTVSTTSRITERLQPQLSPLGRQQQDLLPQAESTLSNTLQEQFATTEHVENLFIPQQPDEQQRQQTRGPQSQTTSDIAAAAAFYRDVRRLRCGIHSLNHQIDSIQRLCRARMEMLQMQHIRRVWGNLQRQMNSLHGAVHQMPQSDTSGPEATEEDQPAQVPNVRQLLELARISDSDPADESSELRTSSSSGCENDVTPECVQLVTEEAASVQSSQDRTGDGQIVAKRARMDSQSSSGATSREHVSDGGDASSKIQNTGSGLSTGNTNCSVIEEGHRHGNISEIERSKVERKSSSSGTLTSTKETSGSNAVELCARYTSSVPKVTNDSAPSKGNISNDAFQETGSNDVASHVTGRERPSVQGQSTQIRSEKLVGHKASLARLTTAGCSSASCSASQNSDCAADPSKSSVCGSCGEGTGRNIDVTTQSDRLSQQERINEMQNMVRGLQERLNHRRFLNQRARRLPERDPMSVWNFCPSHRLQVAHEGACRNCGSRLPNTTPLHINSPRLQPTTVHLGTDLPQPRPIYTSVRPQEMVASSHSRPTNLVPRGSISHNSLQQTHSEVHHSNCGNVQEEKPLCVNNSVSSSKEMANEQQCERKLTDTKSTSCFEGTCCKTNTQEILNDVPLKSVNQRTNGEKGENAVSRQNDNSKEQEIPKREHSQNLVICSDIKAGVSNSAKSATGSHNESISHSNLVDASQEELPCDPLTLNVTNKPNTNCVHSNMSTTHCAQNNSIEANSSSPAEKPTYLLSEAAAYPLSENVAYPSNVHSFVQVVDTNVCGNLDESPSHHVDAQQNTHQNPTPEDLSSPERRAVSASDQSAQVNPSSQQNVDNSHDMECTSPSLHCDSPTVQGADRKMTVTQSVQRSLSLTASLARALACYSAQRSNPSTISRQGPRPDPPLLPRPGPLLTPRASPLLMPGSVQGSLRGPRMLHVSGRYFVPRPRFHHRTGHCSRGRTQSRPVIPAEPLRRPWFLQNLSQTFRSCTGRSGGELGGRCNEFIQQIGATPRNPVLRPTRNCVNRMQQRGNHGNCNRCAENGESCLPSTNSVESSNDNSQENYGEQRVESTSQASSSNCRETVFESRVETAVNMTKGQALSCALDTTEQPRESSSPKPSTSVKSDQFVAHNDMDCAQLPEVEVNLAVLQSSSDNGDACTENSSASDNTVSQAVTEIPHCSPSLASGSSVSEPFNTQLDSSTIKDMAFSVSQNVECRAHHSATVSESAPGSSSHSLASINESSSSSQCAVFNKEGITENMSQKTIEAPISQSLSERTNNVTNSQPQESVGRSAATQTPGPPLGQPDSVGPSVASDPPASQTGVCQQFPRYATGQTVRDIFGRLQRLLDHERLYRQSFLEPRLPTNPSPTRRAGGGFNTTPAHSNSAADVWGRWTRRHSDILPERNAEDEGTPYTGQAASVAAERLITALQTELCETERLYQRLVNLPRTSTNPDQIPAELSQETTRQRARQVLCVMIESLTQVFEENDTFNNFSRDVSDSRVRAFLSDLYFLLQLSVELVDLLLVQIARPWSCVGDQLENRIEGGFNLRHNMRDQISHSRPRGTGSFRFYARRGTGGHRPTDVYSRQPSAGTSGPETVRPSPARTLSRHRSGNSLVRGSWAQRFFSGSVSASSEVPQRTVVPDAAIPQVCVVSPVARGGHVDSERGGAVSRSSRLPASTRGVRGRSQRGSNTSHHGSHERHSHLFHNFHNYCRQPEEEGQEQQQQSQPGQRLHQHNQQQHQNQEEQDEQQHLERQIQDREHAQEQNLAYHNEDSHNQRGTNQEHSASGLQILNSSRDNRQQAQRRSAMFAVPAVQLNDVPIADVGQLSQIEPPHIRPQSPPANPFGGVSRHSQQMWGRLPPSERWLVNFDEVYPNPGYANSAERRLGLLGYGYPSFTSNASGSSRGPVHNSPPVYDGHMPRQRESWTNSIPTGWRSRFLHPRYVGPNVFNEEAFASIENFSFIRGPDTVIITDAPMSPNHRIQAWDISKFKLPDISNAEKNIIVPECKIHNDASVDVSKDGTLLVTLLPSTRICVTTMLGIYSLEWESLGQCLYTTSFEQNAVSVSLSPACRHLLVGLASRRIVLPTDRPTVAQIFRMEGAKPGRSIGGRGRLCHLRDIEQNRENSFTSLNCIRWAPEPGQGLVYGTNTGTLRVLR